MQNPLIQSAEAAVVAHYAALLAGRLDQRHLVERTRALCDEARRAVRILLGEAVPAQPDEVAPPAYRVVAGASDFKVRRSGT